MGHVLLIVVIVLVEEGTVDVRIRGCTTVIIRIHKCTHMSLGEGGRSSGRPLGNVGVCLVMPFLQEQVARNA
jgi:hypothetical protein